MKLPETKIHWIEVCTYSAYGKVDSHHHDFFHYIYVLTGTGEITIGTNVYPFRPKHMYLMAPGKEHTFCNDSSERLVTLEIKFRYYDAAVAANLAALPECIDTTDTPILSILHNIRREMVGNAAYAQDVITLNMQEICLHLMRLSGGTAAVSGRDDLTKVIAYIENNLDCDMNLQDLANIVGLEKTYFLKKFKLLTGTTPMAYTRDFRIRRAKELLVFSDMNVTQIAEAVGFRSIHYFTRRFTDQEGMPPSQYKRLHQSPAGNP
jgi:AraC-like DNA-binding protein